MTDTDERFRISTVLAWCAAVAVACISGTYAVTNNLINTELEQYRKSQDWKLPDLLKNLGEISSTLNSQLQDNAELERLKEFEAKHATKFTVLSAEVTALKHRLRSVEGDSVILKTSETVPLGEKGLLLGLKSVGITIDTVYLSCGNTSITLDIGERQDCESSTTKYTLSYKGRSGNGYEIIVVRTPLSEGSGGA